MPRINELGQLIGDPVPGWEPRARPRPVTLTGRTVAVEHVAERHVADLFDALAGPDDDELWTYRPDSKPTDVDDLAARVATWSTAEETLTFALVPLTGPDAGKAAGLASYFRIEPAHGQVEVAAVMFARRLQRTTAATEAIHLLMRHAFGDLGYRRFEWKCDSCNEPSRRAAARFGFVYEGRFRNHMVYAGRSRDTDWFSVTDDEWPAVRAAHERWLDPSNFDADGQQRTPLAAPPEG